MNKGAYAGGKIFEPETIVSMYTNQIKDLGKSTGLGWEIKQPLVMGKHMSRKAFGKTGFTGCIMIIDPVKHIALVHLSNRTYPHRPETRNAINLFRRTLANMVFSAA
jgi:beta-N-acetylhexosaminidase